jgi:phosphoglucosamine mutase
MPRLFGTDGIRDRAGRGWLVPANVRRLAQVVGTLLRRRPALFRVPLPPAFPLLSGPDRVRGRYGLDLVLIGRDTRASGPAIERALIDGLASSGIPVHAMGVVPTPAVAYATWAGLCSLGIVISASHNPARDNGIKFFSPQGFKIPDDAEAEIERRLARRALPAVATARAEADRSSGGGLYLDHLAACCRELKGLRIVADAAHGAASAFVGPLFRRLGARAVVINASPDGRNINRSCGALHPEAVARAVLREKADAGVAFDGDADRAIFVDEKGVVRDGDFVLALCATDLKAKRRLPGNTVVSTVMANFGLERHLASRGIRLRRTKVGDRYVAEEMLRAGAVLGGEQSGHVLFFDASPAGDGMLTALRVFDILARRGRPLSELMGILKRYPQELLNVPVRRKTPLDRVAAVSRAIGDAERALGREGRILVRYSGTEPLCRVMVEGADARLVGRLARSVADTVRKALA